jgi:hypothetical protein
MRKKRVSCFVSPSSDIPYRNVCKVYAYLFRVSLRLRAVQESLRKETFIWHNLWPVIASDTTCDVFVYQLLCRQYECVSVMHDQYKQRPVCCVPVTWPYSGKLRQRSRETASLGCSVLTGAGLFLECTSAFHWHQWNVRWKFIRKDVTIPISCCGFHWSTRGFIVRQLHRWLSLDSIFNSRWEAITSYWLSHWTHGIFLP